MVGGGGGEGEAEGGQSGQIVRELRTLHPAGLIATSSSLNMARQPLTGTVSLVYIYIKWLKLASLDKPWLWHQALAILNKFYCPFFLLHALKFLKRLKPNPFKVAASIMNVDSKWLTHSKFKTPHLWCRWSRNHYKGANSLFFYKSLRQILPGSDCFVVPHDAFFFNLTDLFMQVQLQLLQLNHCTESMLFFICEPHKSFLHFFFFCGPQGPAYSKVSSQTATKIAVCPPLSYTCTVQVYIHVKIVHVFMFMYINMFMQSAPMKLWTAIVWIFRLLWLCYRPVVILTFLMCTKMSQTGFHRPGCRTVILKVHMH